MKNILNYIFLLSVILVLGVSCRDEEAVRFPEVKEGVNARVILYPDRSFINLDDLNQSSVAFDIYSINSDIEEIVYTAHFTDADSTNAIFPSFTAFTVSGADFASGKVTELEMTAAEIAERFGLPGGTAYFEGADRVRFTTKVTLTDGRTFDATNSAPSITGSAAASFTTEFSVFVGCPSNQQAIAGEYEATMIYNNYGLDFNKTMDVTVTFVGPEPFRYHVTDHTVELYVPFGGTEYPADFYDICGQSIMLQSQSFGTVLNYVTDDPQFLAPVIDTSTEQTTFVLNWNETSNVLQASVKFVKKI